MTIQTCEESAISDDRHQWVPCGNHVRSYVACCGWFMCFDHGHEHLLVCDYVDGYADRNDGD
jgi:hypothetical protein